MNEQSITQITPVTLIVGMLASLVIGGLLGATVLTTDSEGVHSAHMQAQMDGMMAALDGKTGSEFDKAFLTEMIVHHEGAVAMAMAALQHAERPEVRKLAETIVDAQTTEIAQMQAWRTAWFPEDAQ